METINQNETGFNEAQSLETIRTAIANSKKKLMDDGILLLTWGLTFSISNFWKYYNSVVLTPWWLKNSMNYLQWIMGIGAVALTAYFIFFRKNRATTLTAISTRYLWIGVILAHNMIIIITKSFLNEINFTLLQPLQMVLIGFALFVSGGIYRYYLLVAGGVIMWIAASISAGYDLNLQFLIRSIAEFVCFIIPGYLMIRSKKNI
jgi:hypothetical protein